MIMGADGRMLPGGLYYLDFSGQLFIKSIKCRVFSKQHTQTEYTHIVNEGVEMVIDMQSKGCVSRDSEARMKLKSVQVLDYVIMIRGRAKMYECGGWK